MTCVHRLLSVEFEFTITACAILNGHLYQHLSRDKAEISKYISKEFHDFIILKAKQEIMINYLYSLRKMEC